MWLQQGAKAGRASWAEAQAVEGDEEVSRDTFLLLGVAGAQIWARLRKGQPKISWSPAKKPDAVCEQKVVSVSAWKAFSLSSSRLLERRPLLFTESERSLKDLET